MNKASHEKAHMMAKAMVRIATNKNSYDDLERVDLMYDWFKRTGRQDIIDEAESLRDARLRDLGLA